MIEVDITAEIGIICELSPAGIHPIESRLTKPAGVEPAELEEASSLPLMPKPARDTPPNGSDYCHILLIMPSINPEQS